MTSALNGTLRHEIENSTTGQLAGITFAILLALGVTGVAASVGWTWSWNDWGGWPLFSVVILIAAWVNVIAWIARLWPLAIVCSLLTFLAPWGFLYPGIVAGPALAIAAAVAWTRGRPLPSTALLVGPTAKTAVGGHSSDARVQRMDLAREAIETLRAANFPIYAVPPSEFAGDVMVRGVSGERKHTLAITMSYDDDLSVETPQRQIEIVSTGAEGMSKRAPSHFFLLSDFSYETEIANFVNNIAPVRLPEDSNGVPNPGLRRPLPTVTFRDELFLERVAFDHHPEFRLYRVQMPRVEILVMGWNWDDEALTEFARKVHPIQEDTELFAEIEAAEFAAWANIDKRRGRA